MDTPLPKIFVKSIDSFIKGDELEKFVQKMEEAPATGVRLNRRKPTPNPIYPDMKPVEWCNSAFYLPSRPQFTLNPHLHGGAFYVQDPSSTVYETIVEKILHLPDFPNPHSPAVLDLCAAPGGKTTAIINALPDDALIVANEYNEKRARILEENLKKWGFPNCIITNSPTSRFAECGEIFNLVAVDAPCSGEGMMRKEEEARRQWNPGLVEQCATLQKSIIKDAVKVLTEGGYLIYSTCTFNPLENEENTEFIVKELGLEPVEITSVGVPEKSTMISKSFTNIPSIRFMPHITDGEGLFVAIFRKGTGINPAYMSSKGRREKNKKSFLKTDAFPTLKRVIDELYGTFYCKEIGSKISLVTPEIEEMSERLKGIRILSAGIEAGEIKGKDFIPSTSLALISSFRDNPFPDIPLSKEDALSFLRRENIILPDDTPRGYVTVSFEGTRLGFAKHLGNRTNNLYPSYWRIRTL